MGESRPNSLGALATEGAVLAQAKDENFPVASRLLPRRVRCHLLALYAFARLVDDAGDESGARAPELLDAIERDLDRMGAGHPVHPIVRRLADTVRACDLPVEPLRHLLEANRRDQVVVRYRTFEELLGYCELSANPIGRLVLGVFGMATRERVELSDRVCAALQLVEHLQDIREDHGRGRVYVPGDDLARFGVAESDLGARRASAAVRGLVEFEAGRTRDLLRAGAPLVRTLHGRLRWAVAGFVAGGAATLDAIELARHDVLAVKVRSTRALFGRAFVAALRGAVG